MKKVEKAVLITTKHRGVFFGYTSESVKRRAITIKNARNCIYWSSDIKGFLGLAVTGPSSTCRIGPKVIAMQIRDITAVVEVSSEAIKEWEKSPWSL